MVAVYSPDQPGTVQTFSCDARMAVISAYAQSLKDLNTWDYDRKYGDMVQVIDNRLGKRFVCGTFWCRV